MKFPLPFYLALAAFVQAAGLDFAETSKEVHTTADAETAAVEFNFTNKSGKPITIAKADAGWSCMKVLFSGGKLTYGPGEIGVLRAVFNIGNASGTVEKSIALWLDTAPITNPPSQSLNVRIHIPTLITLEPKTLKWDSGSKQEPQTLHIRIAEGKPIHVTAIQPSTEQFSCELKAIEQGRNYDLVVTPRDTTLLGLCALRIVTDCEIPRHQIQQAFAVVWKPAAEAKASEKTHP